MIPIFWKTPEAVMTTLKWIQHQNVEPEMLYQDDYHEQRFRIRKTIKPDSISKTLIYFVYPYNSCEKESVERHNGQIRRFIPEGKRFTVAVRSK